MADASRPRKFKVEPIETSARKTPRKFAHEPIETMSKSSRKISEEPLEKPAPRKFAVEQIETTHTTNKKSSEALSEFKKAPKKLAPQLIDTSSEHRKPKERGTEEENSKSHDCEERADSDPVIEELPSRRKFAPVLIDTAKRTRRAGDLRPAHLPSDRTDSIPGEANGILRQPRKAQFPDQPENTPASTSLPSPASLSSAECRRLGIPVPRRQTSTSSQRPHSFRAPTLDPIDSSESGGEDSDHSSTGSNHSSSSDMSHHLWQHATRVRESVDASSRGYLLELAAKAAERQLRDQADAAFPNSDRHVRVDHYIGHDHDDSTRRSSRASQDQRRYDSVNWELKDMRKHAEYLEAKKERERAAREARRKWNKEYEEKSGPWRNPFKNHVPHNKTTHKENAEMERMRKKVRPPMLGGDIQFPRCPSPEPARFDVTQGTYNERTAMCYLTTEAGPGPCGEGLWAVRVKNTIAPVALQSPAESRAPSTGSSPGGLWGGFCKGQAGNLSPPRGPTGLLTPAIMDENVGNPFDAFHANRHLHQLPPSPPPSNSGVASLDEKLEIEQNIENEFSDEFITQVYNYLSLGYPSLARKYDDELAKITRTPVTDLRQDDELESSRGYVRFGEDGTSEEDGIKENMCARWKALKAYIHEWARQQPGMQEPNNRYGGFGVAVRRGSWAW